jgi:excisionase family DNA binding protein
MTTGTDPRVGPALMLRRREVAALLGLSERTVARLIACGELPVVHVGRSMRIARRDVEQWVERMRGEEVRS